MDLTGEVCRGIRGENYQSVGRFITRFSYIYTAPASCFAQISALLRLLS